MSVAVKCVVIDKNSNKKNVNVNTEDFYKKCGFRNDKDFGYRNTWKVKDNGEDKYLSVFAKNKGRANTENKYELPPPIDNDLFFGSIMIVKHENKDDYKLSDLIELSVEEWEKYYEKLYGGFEDLGEEDSYSSEEEVDPEMLTKEGYSKEDGFIVDDEEEIIDDSGGEESDEEEEEEEEYVQGEESDDEDEEEESDDEDESDYDSEESYIASELEEEEYVNTDED